jgi:hypothetical protein
MPEHHPTPEQPADPTESISQELGAAALKEPAFDENLECTSCGAHIAEPCDPECPREIARLKAEEAEENKS